MGQSRCKGIGVAVVAAADYAWTNAEKRKGLAMWVAAVGGPVGVGSWDGVAGSTLWSADGGEDWREGHPVEWRWDDSGGRRIVSEQLGE